MILAERWDHWSEHHGCLFRFRKPANFEVFATGLAHHGIGVGPNGEVTRAITEALGPAVISTGRNAATSFPLPTSAHRRRPTTGAHLCYPHEHG